MPPGRSGSDHLHRTAPGRAPPAGVDADARSAPSDSAAPTGAWPSTRALSEQLVRDLDGHALHIRDEDRDRYHAAARMAATTSSPCSVMSAWRPPSVPLCRLPEPDPPARRHVTPSPDRDPHGAGEAPRSLAPAAPRRRPAARRAGGLPRHGREAVKLWHHLPSSTRSPASGAALDVARPTATSSASCRPWATSTTATCR